MLNCFTTDQSEPFLTITPIVSDQLPAWLDQQTPFIQAWIKDNRFGQTPGEFIKIPNAAGQLQQVVVLLAARDDWRVLGVLVKQLPPGVYRLIDSLQVFSSPAALERAYLAWGFDSYRLKSKAQIQPQLELTDLAMAERVIAWVTTAAWLRDLVNRPSTDLGPAELSLSAQQLAQQFNAQFTAIIGDDLLTANYPAIHAVGRGSDRAPRLLDLTWGQPEHPSLVLIGKGVCFDSGGLNLKSAPGMLKMRKDMAGAMHALALARMIMQQRLPIRLRVLLPCVENLLSGHAYRPGDIVRTRAGLTIDVTNTDAEGRVILADALYEAASSQPRLIIDFATLTGGHALGPDIPVFYTRDNELAAQLLQASQAAEDMIWRLPLYQPYRRYIESPTADLANAAVQPIAPSTLAALFLADFVTPSVPWLHFDLVAWNDQALPAKPQGADMLALRAVFAYLVQYFIQPQ